MNIGILLAAGTSGRFKKGDKLFAQLLGKPVVFHALQLLEDSPKVDAIIIAANSHNRKKIAEIVRNEKFKKVKKIIIGGQTRFESIKKAAQYSPPAALFIVHNGANPLAGAAELRRCFAILRRHNIDGVAVGRSVHPTLKKIKGKYEIEGTMPRSSLWEMETPQVVKASVFLAAIKKLPKKKNDYTDDLAVLEEAGKKTAVAPASFRNRKITTTEDLQWLRVAAQEHAQMLVGIGEDSHRFSEKKKNGLVLAGVKISNSPSLEAQSDGDVMIHALCNAISSALGRGSLGTFATALCRKGVRDSTKYLRAVLLTLKRNHRAIHNCSFSLEAARPTIDPWVPLFKEKLSKLLGVSPQHIGITATSGENLTPFGRGEGIKCQAAVTLTRL